MPNAQKRNRSLFKALAILLGLLPLALLELALHLFGIGADAATDPLSGFNSRIPLFERDGANYHTAKAREPFVSFQEFPAKKSSNTFRVFCFGGSTVYGHPYLSDTAFPKWLEIELSARVTNRTFDVINCGGVSYASYRIAPLVREVIQYQPDLIIVATGENEFLEDRTYHSIKNRSRARRWIEDTLQSSRIVSIARDWLHHKNTSSAPPTGNVEIQTKLDSPGGYASYHRDDRWHDQVAEQFEDSLRQIVQTCQTARIPLFLIKLGCNLRDCPPYKSEHPADISTANEQAWQQHFDAGAAEEKTDPHSAMAEYRAAEKIDPRYALLLYRMGRLLDEQKKESEALDYYIRARDEDVCPLRMPTRHEQILSRVAAERRVPLIDAAGIIAAQSLDHIPGNDWYLDHVHPNIGGDQLISQALAEQAISMQLASPARPWSDTERETAYTRHMQNLPNSYLAEGSRRIEWLEHWARREKLYDESLPRDAEAFLRAGFRHIEVADYDNAQREINNGLRMNPALTNIVQREASLLRKEGRPNTAQIVIGWLK